jgi:hypothetical protein
MKHKKSPKVQYDVGKITVVVCAPLIVMVVETAEGADSFRQYPSD